MKHEMPDHIFLFFPIYSFFFFFLVRDHIFLVKESKEGYLSRARTAVSILVFIDSIEVPWSFLVARKSDESSSSRALHKFICLQKLEIDHLIEAKIIIFRWLFVHIIQNKVITSPSHHFINCHKQQKNWVAHVSCFLRS